MTKFPAHLFAEPEPDVDTLANLGPLAPMAGVWEGVKGRDVKPTEDGAEEQTYIERMTIQPIDPQMNGPQLLYGLRYHTAITKPGEVEMYHDQVGYWLWEPATGRILHTLTIPRGQTALAKGEAAADATTFTLTAQRAAPRTAFPRPFSLRKISAPTVSRSPSLSMGRISGAMPRPPC
jgi:hypothetical protein